MLSYGCERRNERYVYAERLSLTLTYVYIDEEKKTCVCMYKNIYIVRADGT